MGETACLITIMFRMRRTELECRRGVLLLRPLCCRSLCRNMFLYTGSKQIPDIAFDLTELLGSVNREAQIKAERKNVSYAVDWERADLPFICLLGNPVYAARTIRAMQREDAETVPIFAMSANCFAEDIVNSRIAGMNEHLTKPLNEKKLLEVIRKYLRRADHRE